MRGTFTADVQAAISDQWFDAETGDPSLEFSIVDVRCRTKSGSWDDDADSLISTCPDGLSIDLLPDIITEPGVYKVSGEYDMDDFEDHYGDIQFSNVLIVENKDNKD